MSTIAADVARVARTRVRMPFAADALSRGAIVVLAALILFGLLAPVLPIGQPDALTGTRLATPSWQDPFGTDHLGRAVLPRVAQGIRLTFLLATLAVLIAALVGALLGMLAAYLHRVLDEVVVRGSDMLFSFPAILLAILISAITGPGTATAVAAVVLVTLPAMVRVVRAATLSVVEFDFLTAAEVAGATTRRIVIVHILPNVAGAIVVQAAYSISVGMLVESVMSFLGLGVQAPNASLGSLLGEGRLYLPVAPWLVFLPGAFLAAAILSVNLLSDGLSRVIDPLESRSLR